MIYLDTHVIVWLYASELHRFPANVQNQLETNELKISPIVLLELKYLEEIDRLNANPNDIRNSLATSIDLQVCDRPLVDVVITAMSLAWTRDPFDRIIVAQASISNDRLITKDNMILSNYEHAFW